MIKTILLVFTLLTWVYCSPLRLSNRHSRLLESRRTSDALAYLKQYNYVGSSTTDDRAGQLTDPEATLVEGLKLFQRKWNLRMTGSLTAETLSLMRKPRCGVPDLYIGEDSQGTTLTRSSRTRGKRYDLQGSRWDKASLTYKITRYPDENSISNTKLSRSTIVREIQRALKVWEDVIPLRFTQTSGTPDIDIQFLVGDHGDGYRFKSTTPIAHAFFPEFGGAAHFNNELFFTSQGNEGYNLFQIAAHEFGHSLGLKHSVIKSAFMYPYYQSYSPNLRLHNDDIEGIQEIYGRGTIPQFEASKAFAAGNWTKSVISSFDSEQYYKANAYVTGLSAWLKNYVWYDGGLKQTIIVGGLQVFYSDGQSPRYGDTTSNDVRVLTLDRGDRITGINLSYGFNGGLENGLIDRLSFTSQAGVEWEAGGRGGDWVEVTPPRGNSYLAGINGRVVNVRGSTTIDALSFIWASP